MTAPKAPVCEACLARPPQAEYTMCRPCWRSEVRPGESIAAWQQRRRALAKKTPPPLPRAVRELLRDVVLLERSAWPLEDGMRLGKRAAKLLGTTPAAIVARARKVSK